MVPLNGAVRPVRIPLKGRVSATDGCLLLRGDRRPFALTGAWAGGGALVGSEPVRVAGADEEPFALLDRQPPVERSAPSDVVGGGWVGYLGYGLGARLEPVPPPPPRPAPLPDFALAFYDHLLRLDATGRWWFEALWTDDRDAALRSRLDVLRERLAAAVRRRPVSVGQFEPSPSGASGHLAAVEACRERIAAGEIFQANICLRLEGRWGGESLGGGPLDGEPVRDGPLDGHALAGGPCDGGAPLDAYALGGGPLDLFARMAGALGPRHAALVAGPWGSLCSLSPELFLRRRGRRVISEPIKGTTPRQQEARSALAASPKDRAENVMIVDLMRNDLGRVCEYGSIEVPALNEPRPAPGVWHLVSTVTGTLRPDVGDGDLVRACFPPGSVTGAPKIQSMRVIAELEATGREAYTGAIGYASPLAGLELNVAIRTLETRGERIWLGVGGGIVADSEPGRELEECFVKALPLVRATGGTLRGVGLLDAAYGESKGLHASIPPAALAGADRPDPALGVFETLLVVDGQAVAAEAHLARLAHSIQELYGQVLPDDLPQRLEDAAATRPLQRLRVLAAPAAGAVAAVELDVQPLADEPRPESVELAPAFLPGGLGAHKWRDRRLLAELERRAGGAVPLLLDLDGEVLEAGSANVWIVEGTTLTTPPLDGRLLPGTVRAQLLAAGPPGLDTHEAPITLERLAAADEVLLSSSIRGVRPAALGGTTPRFEVGASLCDALLERPRLVGAR